MTSPATDQSGNNVFYLPTDRPAGAFSVVDSTLGEGKPTPGPIAWSSNGDTTQMTDQVGRPELDAKLDGIRQEIRADAAGVRGEFERLRADMAVNSRAMADTVASLAISVAELKGSVGTGNVKLDDVLQSQRSAKWQLFTAAVAIILAFVGSALTVQQLTVSTFQAATQQSAQPTAQQQPPSTQQPSVRTEPKASVPR